MVGENNNWKSVIGTIPRQNYQVRAVYFLDVKLLSNIKHASNIIFKNPKSNEPTALEAGFVEATITGYRLIMSRVILYLV